MSFTGGRGKSTIVNPTLDGDITEDSTAVLNENDFN